MNVKTGKYTQKWHILFTFVIRNLYRTDKLYSVRPWWLLLGVLMTPHIVFAQEAVIEHQIIVDIHVAESGKALVVGYLSGDALGTLPFLGDSNYTYHNDSSQIYAVTDALTAKKGGEWTLNFSLFGYYLDYNLRIYLPPGAEMTGFEIPANFSYKVGLENSSIVLGVEGFQAVSPQVLVSYRQAINGGITEAPSRSYRWIIVPLALTLSFAALLIRRKQRGMPEVSHEKGFEITSEMQKVIDTLTETERSVVKLLIDEGGKVTQAKIRRETGIAKSSLSGIINSLARKKIIKKREYGRTNLIELSEWFISGKEEK